MNKAPLWRERGFSSESPSLRQLWSEGVSYRRAEAVDCSR